MALKKRYYWKRLLEGGTLGEPHPRGPHYEQDALNDDGMGYASEEEAVAAFVEFAQKHNVSDELFLIAGYRLAV